MLEKSFDLLLELALEEDLGNTGDVTSESIFEEEIGTAALFCKDEGVLAGIEFFSRVFKRVDPQLEVIANFKDGDLITKGDLIAEVKGSVKSLLEAERIAINFLSFLSGIASRSREFALAAESGTAVVLDTRKTLPGYRALSKYAVSVGGAKNHRMGLYDMVMIKDNHIDAAGSIIEAVERVRRKHGNEYRVEVECRNLEEVKQALDLNVDVIMLDNMSPEMIIEAVKIRRCSVLYEVSGNMNLDKVKEYSPFGIDYISVGSLTHSVSAFDFSLKIKQED